MLSNSKALEIIETTDPKGKRIPFQIAFVTANRDGWRKYKMVLAERDRHPKDSEKWNECNTALSQIPIGGNIIRHDRCTLSGTRGMHVKKTEQTMMKNPSHWTNRTRNILFHPSNQIRKIHIKLIMEVNNQPVLY